MNDGVLFRPMTRPRVYDEVNCLDFYKCAVQGQMSAIDGRIAKMICLVKRVVLSAISLFRDLRHSARVAQYI